MISLIVFCIFYRNSCKGASEGEDLLENQSIDDCPNYNTDCERRENKYAVSQN